MVTMCADRVRLARSSSAASVVVLPDPVGPVTSTSPRGRCANRATDSGTPSSSQRLDRVRDHPERARRTSRAARRGSPGTGRRPAMLYAKSSSCSRSKAAHCVVVDTASASSASVSAAAELPGTRAATAGRRAAGWSAGRRRSGAGRSRCASTRATSILSSSARGSLSVWCAAAVPKGSSVGRTMPGRSTATAPGLAESAGGSDRHPQHFGQRGLPGGGLGQPVLAQLPHALGQRHPLISLADARCTVSRSISSVIGITSCSAIRPR